MLTRDQEPDIQVSRRASRQINAQIPRGHRCGEGRKPQFRPSRLAMRFSISAQIR